MVNTVLKYKCAGCHVVVEFTKASPAYGDTMPVGWSQVMITGTPTRSMTLCRDCIGAVNRTLESLFAEQA